MMVNRSSAVAPLGWALTVGVVLSLGATVADAASMVLPGVEIKLDGAGESRQEVATGLQILIALTILSLAPAILIVTTAFTRIIVVLAMLRHAFGMPETPPNTVLISLALFLTLFTMSPTLTQINDRAIAPYLSGKISTQRAIDTGLKPLREFMIRQTREQDLQLMIDLAREETPETVDGVKTLHLIPAFMLSELKTAFQIGFVIFLPFLLIDVVVSSVLMSMGMMMVPPMMISMPLKILMFVLIDGWNLVVRSVLGSFQ